MLIERKKQPRSALPLATALMLMFVLGCVSGSGGPGGGSGSDPGASGPNHGVIIPPGPTPQAASNLTVTVVDETGSPLVGGFRWLVEENTTHNVVPKVATADIPALSVHNSHAPVIATGESGTDSAVIMVPDDKRLMVSVLPLEPGYSMSGGYVEIGQTSITLTVNTPPLPTAQISVYVFHDNRPTNSAPDVPAEEPLAGFAVMLHDMAGQMMMDGFGNMIGTTYMQNPDGSYMLDGDGMPMPMMMGTGVVLSDANGEALIKNLAPGKYAVIVVPPAGEGWMQTSTLEGTPVVDAWVQAGEPPYFTEWGNFMWHAFFGFVKEMDFPAPEGNSSTITGQMVYVHENRPPQAPGLHEGRPVEFGYVRACCFMPGRPMKLTMAKCYTVRAKTVGSPV